MESMIPPHFTPDAKATLVPEAKSMLETMSFSELVDLWQYSRERGLYDLSNITSIYINNLVHNLIKITYTKTGFPFSSELLPNAPAIISSFNLSDLVSLEKWCGKISEFGAVAAAAAREKDNRLRKFLKPGSRMATQNSFAI